MSRGGSSQWNGISDSPINQGNLQLWRNWNSFHSKEIAQTLTMLLLWDGKSIFVCGKDKNTPIDFKEK